MTKQKLLNILTFAGLILLTTNLFAQDHNFYIYLCFGQSNMQGQGPIQSQDQSVNSRFRTFQAMDCSNLNRKKAMWYTAVPPTCQCYSSLSPADYFGRTMVANLPDSIKVGIINVSVAGCDIRLFDKDIYQNYDSTYKDSWYTSLVAGYNWNPYKYLVDLAKLAQKDGVIKGILLHQGESNTGDTQWPNYVKKIYNDMLKDLSLKADSVPLLAGEVLSAPGNCCSYMNTIIDRLPLTIPTAHVISSSGCTGQDAAHFDSPGYRKFGTRYGIQGLSLVGYECIYAEAECGTVGSELYVLADNNASNSAYVTISSGKGNSSTVPSSDASLIKMNVTIKKDAKYYLYGRIKNAGVSSNSIWVKIDNGNFEFYSIKTTIGWEWLELKSNSLSAGDHILSFAFGDGTVMLDKIAIKNSEIKPVNAGEEAAKICTPKITPTGYSDLKLEGYTLEQNSPNPVSTNEVDFSFQIPNTCFVSLKIYNSLGICVGEIAGKVFNPGKHIIHYNLEKRSPGTYFYTMKTDLFSETRKMIISAK